MGFSLEWRCFCSDSFKLVLSVADMIFIKINFISFWIWCVIVKTILFSIVFFLLIPSFSHARDYMVQFQREYYREQVADSIHHSKLYHALQVDSPSGSKLLVLNGDNPEYRIWLREYLVHYKKLIINVPDSEDENFRTAMEFKINITDVYPIDGKKWKQSESGMGSMPAFKGQKHVLIVDDNMKRRKLQKLIVNNLGYPATLSANGIDALKMFRMQPDKFFMVITENKIPGMSGTDLIKHLVKDNPNLPVILGTGYNRKVKLGNNTGDLFAGANKIIVKSPVLEELSKSIIKLLGRKA